VCILCGAIANNNFITCDKCPVKYCSLKCKNNIEKAHKDYDCDTYNKIFK
jgi:hypothetical protein